MKGAEKGGDGFFSSLPLLPFFFSVVGLLASPSSAAASLASATIAPALVDCCAAGVWQRHARVRASRAERGTERETQRERNEAEREERAAEVDGLSSVGGAVIFFFSFDLLPLSLPKPTCSAAATARAAQPRFRAPPRPKARRKPAQLTPLSLSLPLLTVPKKNTKKKLSPRRVC